MVEVILVVAAVLRVGYHRRHGTAPASCPPRALLVVGDVGSHVTQADAQQAPNVDAHFHSRGHRKNVDAVVFRLLRRPV